MLFNSVAYLFFLPVVVLLYYLIPHKYRWILLLAASYFFYGYWRIEYLSLILLSTGIDYSISNFLDRSTNSRKRKLALITSICTNLGILFFFKYFNFFLGEVVQEVGREEIYWRIGRLYELSDFLLPVGISFYTFQTLGYTIDVYYRQTRAEKHLGKFALFVSYFPQLVAGPIERFSRLMPQLQTHHQFSYANMASGFRLLLFGFFIKMVIADNLSSYVDQFFNDPDAYDTTDALTGIFFFGFQIYSDFYGYSLIAIGSAKLLGVDLMDNFKTPYLARSISEFWQRWHISLSTWFRDYLYIPLGGNRAKLLRWSVNILIVFILSGLWHGANWTFIIWGALHGIIYLSEKHFPFRFSTGNGLFQIVGGIKTFLVVHIAWVFFRANSLDNAQAVLIAPFQSGSGSNVLAVSDSTWALFFLFLVMDIALQGTRFDKWCENQSTTIRWGTYAVLIFAIMALAGTVNHPFIYFQF